MFPPPDPPAGAGSPGDDDNGAMMDEDAMLQAAIAASMEVKEERDRESLNDVDGGEKRSRTHGRDFSLSNASYLSSPLLLAQA